MSVMSTSGAAGSIYANRRKRGGKKTVSREGASKTARARGGMSPASNAGSGGRRARSFAPTEPLATPARRRSLEKSRPRGGARTAAAATRSAATTARKKDWGKALNFAKSKSGAATTARKPASAASRAKRAKAMQEYTRDISAFKKSAAGSKSRPSARAKAETAARRPSGRNAESRDRKYAAMTKSMPRPSSGARKKAPPAQSAQMADRKAYARAYGRGTAEFAKKRAAPASPAQKRRANLSGGKPIPRQGGHKKAAQAMRAEHVKRTRATNQRRASAAKRVSGRGVRGPGLGGRR